MRNNKIVITIFIAFVVILAVCLASCNSTEDKNVSSFAILEVSSGVSEAEKIQQAYRRELSFSSQALDQTEKVIQEHVERLKAMDKNGSEREGVNFVGYNAHLSESGRLVVDGYLRNFSGNEICDIVCNITVKDGETQDYVAVSQLSLHESLENERTRPVSITFDADNVNVGNLDLSKLEYLSEITFKQK